MIVKDITNGVINTMVEECRKEENQRKIQENIIDPIIYYVINQMYPYLLGTSILFILIFVMAALILYFIIKLSANSKITITAIAD